jgi:hypothetical protein
VATDPTLALAEALALLKFGENLEMPSTGYLDKWIEITLIRNRERKWRTRTQETKVLTMFYMECPYMCGL